MSSGAVRNLDQTREICMAKIRKICTAKIGQVRMTKIDSICMAKINEIWMPVSQNCFHAVPKQNNNFVYIVERVHCRELIISGKWIFLLSSKPHNKKTKSRTEQFRTSISSLTEVSAIISLAYEMEVIHLVRSFSVGLTFAGVLPFCRGCCLQETSIIIPTSPRYCHCSRKSIRKLSATKFRL